MQRLREENVVHWRCRINTRGCIVPSPASGAPTLKNFKLWKRRVHGRFNRVICAYEREINTPRVVASRLRFQVGRAKWLERNSGVMAGQIPNFWQSNKPMGLPWKTRPLCFVVHYHCLFPSLTKVTPWLLGLLGSLSALLESDLTTKRYYYILH